MPTPQDLIVETLGECRFESPLAEHGAVFVSEETRVRLEDEIGPGASAPEDVTFEKGGPRPRLFFDPPASTVALVTCGGLSPGLNNVIRSAYYELVHNYGVRRVLGIREGYRGLNPAEGRPPIELSEEFVHDIHNLGGTVLGSSRGGQEPGVVVDFLESEGIDALLCLGGDGTQRGAHAIAEEIAKRGLAKSVVGIPKTIDNDIPYVWMSFGYATAAEIAQEVVRGAHVEALGAPGGIGLVKVMGRSAGFIAAGAAVASQEANFVLVPEVPFPLEGENGFLAALQRRVERRGHAVVIVAEGAGQHLFDTEDAERDASGNVRFQDIGVFLRDRIKAHFEAAGIEANLKYIDPSYAIRSVPANAWDRILSDRMARMAVHAAMAGKTDMLIGFHHESLIHVPIGAAVANRREMDLSSDLWQAVRACTGQPRW
ncbi:MAG: ATP-dependent 6-phosphofructokinase [Myxococcota bacterium]|nr:ATP-dependent 6-phosphofructokinase [Myxococcota bacterium]